jgi:hypothetical protein
VVAPSVCGESSTLWILTSVTNFLLSVLSLAATVAACALWWLALEVRLIRCGKVAPGLVPAAIRAGGKPERREDDDEEEGPDFLNYENLRN